MKTNGNFFLKTMITTLMVFAFINVASAKNNGKGRGTDNNNGQHNNNSGYTQTNGTSTNNNGGKKNDSVPLDGGLGILLAGAAFYGVKKLRKS